jgi:hypothetical protein
MESFKSAWYFAVKTIDPLNLLEQYEYDQPKMQIRMANNVLALMYNPKLQKIVQFALFTLH